MGGIGHSISEPRREEGRGTRIGSVNVLWLQPRDSSSLLLTLDSRHGWMLTQINAAIIEQLLQLGFDLRFLGAGFFFLNKATEQDQSRMWFYLYERLFAGMTGALR